MNSNSMSTWKHKAIQRQIQLKNMRKRLIEVKNSRDKWKHKSKKHIKEINSLETELEGIKKNLMKIINQ